MKKVFLISLALLTVASLSFTADFNPTLLTLTVPEAIQYDFDGTELSIPFTVTGTPAAVWLVINTNGKADQIAGVRNGYLGWHYVNKVDTTVYISDRYKRSPGETTIVWDGKDQDGNAVAEDTYSYYLWAYDDVTPRQIASDFVQVAHGWDSQYTFIYEKDTNGMIMPAPLLMGGEQSWAMRSWSSEDGSAWFDIATGTHFKWKIGGDPHDVNNYQHTACPGYETMHNRSDPGVGYGYGGPVFDPNDYNIFYHNSMEGEAKIGTMVKWTFVTDGEAIKDEDWLSWDELTWEESGMQIMSSSQKKYMCYRRQLYLCCSSRSPSKRIRME